MFAAVLSDQAHRAATKFAAFVVVSATCLLIPGPAVLPALAQDPAPNTVVATVGGQQVTERDLEYAAGDLAEQFKQVPETHRKAAILNALIDIKSLARQADADGLAEGEDFKARMNFLRDRALHNAYFKERALDAVSDEEVKARYDQEIAAAEPREEIKASHILLKTEDEAKAVIGEIDAGKDFAELAKEKSTGPSSSNGGDLGFFGPGQMVPEFEKAAFALKDGEYTKEPVQTQFGFHVIKRVETRKSEPPAFDQVKDQVRQIVLREKYLKLVEDARAATEVEILDEKLKSQLEEAGVK